MYIDNQFLCSISKISLLQQTHTIIMDLITKDLKRLPYKYDLTLRGNEYNYYKSK